MMRRLIYAGSLLLALCVAPAATTRDATRRLAAPEGRDNSEAQARRLWEEFIAAKGGRERLHAIDKIVISRRGRYITHRGKKNEIRQEALYVLPTKVWSWNDYRPDVFGLRVKMVNYDNKTKYLTSPDDPSNQLKPITDPETKNELLYSLLPYLPETRWSQPVLIKARNGAVGIKPVDVVETILDGERVDFALDRVTHLPLCLTYYYTTQDGELRASSLGLADYVEVNGIQMPQTVIHSDGTAYKATYQFNVKYNEGIFSKPPPFEAGPEGWRLFRPGPG